MATPERPRTAHLPDYLLREELFAVVAFATDLFAVDFLAVVAFATDLFAVDFLAVVAFGVDVFAVDFLAVVAFGVDVLVTGRRPVLFRSAAGSIRAVPAPGANRLSCPSFHRTRYWTRSSPSTTSRISPCRGGPPTLAGLTTITSPFFAIGPPSYQFRTQRGCLAHLAWPYLFSFAARGLRGPRSC